MKKKLVTLMAAAALAAAVAPAASVFANDTFKPVDTKATAVPAELGRAYAIAQADADVAKVQHETLSKIAVAEENTLANLQTVLAAKQAELTAVAQAWDNAKAAAEAFGDANAEGPKSEAWQDAINVAASFGPVYAAAETEVAKAAADVKDQEAVLAKALADKAAAGKVLAEAVAKLEAAKNAYFAAGGKEEAKPAVAKEEVKVAKPAANAVAKADTKTAAKALPKTSAVK